MSMRYKGAVLSATAPTTSSSSAKGVWTMRQQLQAVGGSGWPKQYPWPVANIGDAYGGGFFAGQINVSGTVYNLVVAPKSTGEAVGLRWGDETVNISTSSLDGYANSVAQKAAGSIYQAATFCRNLSIGGYTDWYLPATYELEVLYYYLKPVAYTNYISGGLNPYAVAPEPVSTYYTASVPPMTSIAAFQSGGAQALDGLGGGQSATYWTSTGSTDYYAYAIYFDWADTANGLNGIFGKQYNFNYNITRAIRKVPA